MHIIVLVSATYGGVHLFSYARMPEPGKLVVVVTFSRSSLLLLRISKEMEQVSMCGIHAWCLLLYVEKGDPILYLFPKSGDMNCLQSGSWLCLLLVNINQTKLGYPTGLKDAIGPGGLRAPPLVAVASIADHCFH